MNPKKGDFVIYKAASGVPVRAVVERAHRDGSVRVRSYFFLKLDGTDRPGFLGYCYELSPNDYTLMLERPA